MWETLYARAIGEGATDEEIAVFDKLTDEIRNGKLHNENELLFQVGKKLSDVYGVTTKCKIIEVGKTQEERWNLFEQVVEQIEKGDVISIDITHGLRYQPFILTIALFYLKSLFNIDVKNVYYGALELSRSYYNGKTPIMNLVSLIGMINWTNATFAFTRYGDTSVLSTVLSDEKYSELLNRAAYFNSVLKLNTVGKIRSNAKKFIKEVKQIDQLEKDLIPLKMVKDMILEFPISIRETKADWELMLLLSEKHWQTQNYGLAILAAWESIMERFSEIFQIDIRNDFDNYRKVSQKVRNKELLGEVAKKIGRFRNAIAHAETEKSDAPNYIIEKFPYWFNKLKEELYSEELVARSKKIKFKNSPSLK